VIKAAGAVLEGLAAEFKFRKIVEFRKKAEAASTASAAIKNLTIMEDIIN
jgi:hypothetical protein